MPEVILKLPLPTPKEAADLMPEGRYPYSLTDIYLRSHGVSQNFHSVNAIHALHEAQVDASLRPPMPEVLANAVAALDQRTIVSELGTVHCGAEYDYDVAAKVIRAAFEHGYMNRG